MFPSPLPLSDANFSLSAWAVAGIFGSEESISALALIPLYQGRRWLGWYNSPGGLDVARHLGHLAQSHLRQHSFPRTSESPATSTLFGFDGKLGPKYTATLSGVEMQTVHLGYLAIEHCKEIANAIEIPGRVTIPTHVALIDLDNVDCDHNVPRLSRLNALFALIPVIVSIATCVMRALVYDWYNFSVVLLSIIANGFASIVIDSGKLSLKSVRKPSPGSAPGGGILVPVIWEDIVVAVKAQKAPSMPSREESLVSSSVVDSRTTPSAYAPFSSSSSSCLNLYSFRRARCSVGSCSSARSVYPGCPLSTSPLSGDSLLASLLFQKLSDPRISKFHLGTRTTMAAFVAFVVFHQVPNLPGIAIHKILSTLIPNDTVVWDKWRVAQ